MAKPEATAPKAKKSKQVALGSDGEASDKEDFTTVGKGGKAMQYTSESIYQNLQLIQEARGKKVRPYCCQSFLL